MKKFLKISYVILLIFCCLLSLFVFLIYTGFIHYNSSISMPCGFYIRAFDNNIKVGDIVSLENPRQDLNSSKRLLKRVKYIYEDSSVYLSSRSDEEIRAIAKMDNIRAYDSRDFGLVDKKELTKVYPLLVWR